MMHKLDLEGENVVRLSLNLEYPTTPHTPNTTPLPELKTVVWNDTEPPPPLNTFYIELLVKN